MRLFVSFFATAAMFFAASAANAGAIWTVDASTSDGSPLSGVTQGAQIILDITLRTDDFALAIAGSVNNYDNSIVGLNPLLAAISPAVLNQICLNPATCFGGITNQVGVPGSGAAITFGETTVAGAGVEAEFLGALALAPAGGQGDIDPGIRTDVAGDPQFSIVYTALAPGSTVLQVGTFAEYLDGYTGTVDQDVTNTSVAITVVPEPGTALLMGLGLAGLAAAGRRE